MRADRYTLKEKAKIFIQRFISQIKHLSKILGIYKLEIKAETYEDNIPDQYYMKNDEA